MTKMNRLRGLGALVEDAVEHGSAAVERVHKITAGRPFALLERIPPIAVPARGIHLAYDAITAGVYQTIRHVNRALGATFKLALDVAEHAQRDQTKGQAP